MNKKKVILSVAAIIIIAVLVVLIYGSLPDKKSKDVPTSQTTEEADESQVKNDESIPMVEGGAVEYDFENDITINNGNSGVSDSEKNTNTSSDSSNDSNSNNKDSKDNKTPSNQNDKEDPTAELPSNSKNDGDENTTTESDNENQNDSDNLNEKVVTYEMYHSMSADKQREYLESFESIEKFFDWYNKAKEEYEKQNPDIEIGKDPIDLDNIIK